MKKTLKKSKNEDMNKKSEKMKNKKQEKEKKNWRKKKVGKKEKKAQRGTPEMGPKIDFSHKNRQEKS